MSAKEGIGIPDLLERIVERVPAPTGDPDGPLRALIYDSYYDKYRGAIPSVRVVDGVLKPKMTITFGTNDAIYEVQEVGYNQLRQVKADQLGPGEVGYVVASVRSVKETRAGDTVFDATNKADEALPGYQEVRSFVFAGIYPTDTQQYETLRDALEKLQLNDASLQYQPETSTALGFGFRCGFLGLLHMEIVQERLEREYDLDLVTTVPSVEYKVHLTDGRLVEIENPSLMPPAAVVDRGRGAVREGAHHGPEGLHRAAHDARHRAARDLQEHDLPRPGAGRVRLGVPARRDHPRLLRQDEDGVARLRVARLRDARLPRERPRAARHADQRRRRSTPSRSSSTRTRRTSGGARSPTSSRS